MSTVIWVITCGTSHPVCLGQVAASRCLDGDVVTCSSDYSEITVVYNSEIVDTIETQLAVLYRVVFPIQR